MNELMYHDYSLWLYNNGYICDCDQAQQEYEGWRIMYERGEIQT